MRGAGVGARRATGTGARWRRSGRGPAARQNANKRISNRRVASCAESMPREAASRDRAEAQRPTGPAAAGRHAPCTHADAGAPHGDVLTLQRACCACRGQAVASIGPASRCEASGRTAQPCTAPPNPGASASVLPPLGGPRVRGGDRQAARSSRDRDNKIHLRGGGGGYFAIFTGKAQRDEAAALD